MTNLDNLFDDDVGMDVDEKTLLSVAARYDKRDFEDTTNPNVMMNYYKFLFPFKQLFLWLNQDHAPSRNWSHREFAFTLANDAYLRYNSFANGDDLKKEVVRLNPSRFEIGPVYSGRPKDRKTLNKATFKPLLRELVFDVDMTDYDAIRQCCSDKKICKRCWAFIVLAAKVVDAILRNDFGFQHLLWVYSGRRGIHCWISDRAALELNDEQRKSIVGWIDIVKGGASKDKKVNIPRPLHPSLERSYNLVKDTFRPLILQDQDCFSSQENSEALLKIFPEQGFASELRTKWKKNDYRDSSVAKWDAVREISGSYVNSKSRAKLSKLPKDHQDRILREEATALVDDVILQYTYPRIDTEVSKHLNHLLKSPFCIHPGTGRVCVPFGSMEEVEQFDPESVPTVGKLLGELEKSPEKDWRSTSIKKYVDVFDRHCEGIVKASLARKKAVKTTDF